MKASSLIRGPIQSSFDFSRRIQGNQPPKFPHLFSLPFSTISQTVPSLTELKTEPGVTVIGERARLSFRSETDLQRVTRTRQHPCTTPRVSSPWAQWREHRDVPRNYDSRAKHPGVESYFFFVALSGGWCREEKNGRNKTGLLTYTILVDVEDQGGNDLWWSSSAGNRQLVSIPTGSFPSSAETVCLSENGCTSWSRQGDTRRNYLMRHGDASSRASVTITKALELLCLSPCFGRSHLLAEKSIYMYTYIYNFGI